MKTPYLFSFVLLMVFTISSCIEEKDTDIEKPRVILLSPMPCDTIYFGQDFNFSMRITDNTGLGKISMDLHNNFGHHNHGDHETCNMDEAKEAINPYSNNWIFSLPEGKKDHVYDTLLTLPQNFNDTIIDTGDYHFHIYVTDNEGYQTFTSLDVKALYK